MYKPSDTVKKLIVLLQNSRDLSVHHGNRTLAIDSIKSCKILCKSRRFDISEDVFDSLIYSIQNCNPSVLDEAFKNAEEEVILADIGNAAVPKEPMPELPKPTSDF